MVAGFDRYFQIAPCFRDEDGRADRSPGEFYQLDLEMSFVTQDDVFAAIEPVLARRLRGVRGRPRGDAAAVPAHPLRRGDGARTAPTSPTCATRSCISDVTRGLPRLGLRGLRGGHRAGRASCAPFARPARPRSPRSFFDKLNAVGARAGRARARLRHARRGRRQGPDREVPRRAAAGARCARPPARADGDAVFFVCDTAAGRRTAGRPGRAPSSARSSISSRRTRSASAGSSTSRCTSATRRPGRSSSATTRSRCRRAGSRRCETPGPARRSRPTSTTSSATAWSCRAAPSATTGPTSCTRRSSIAGYSREDVEARFGGMLNAFKFGAPPHGGSAPGIDRIVMLLAGETQHPRGHRLPDEPAGPGPPDAGARRRCRPSGCASCTSSSTCRRPSRRTRAELAHGRLGRERSR